MDGDDGTERPGTGHSMIPAISAEENRIKAILDATQAEAEKRIGEAERTAGLRVERAESDIREKLGQRRNAALERVTSEARAANEKTDREIDELGERARARMARVVEHLVSLALGEEG